MKFNIISLITLITIISSGCSKETINQSSSNSIIVENWLFDVHRYEVNTDSIGYYYHDSITYQGTIKYAKPSNEIEIFYTNDNSIKLTVDSSGVLSNFPTNYCSGQFFPNDSIYVYLKWGGLGGGTTHVINGLKVGK
ncbi:MAG: hypothetical protein HYU68_06315 [Bacteroidetes bacterium]|nr:hypothetical protein [Bacteroidota bacterium]